MIDPYHVHSMELGVGPQETARQTAGQYTIMARLSPSWWPPWRSSSSVVSNQVRVTLSDEVAPSREALDGGRLLDLVKYDLRAESYEDARTGATELLRRDATSVDGYIALGDALRGLNQNADALTAYENALLVAPPPGPDDEPPSYLIDRLAELRERISNR